MKISTGCKITRLGRTAKSVAYLAYTRRPTLKQEIKGSKHNHEQHLCGIIQAGDAGPGIDSPRRFDRRAGGGNNHLDLRSPCLGRGAASDAIGGHSTQRDGPGVRQAGAGAAWDGGLFRRHGDPLPVRVGLGCGVRIFMADLPTPRYEATLVALFYAVVIWIVMHAAIMVATTSHPDYFDPMVVIGGFMSHFFYAVPLALTVKQRLAATG